MTKVITTLQAMSHPTVVATINCLSEMSQRLKDENEELKAEVAAEREACAKVCDKQAEGAYWEGADACAELIRARGQE